MGVVPRRRVGQIGVGVCRVPLDPQVVRQGDADIATGGEFLFVVERQDAVVVLRRRGEEILEPVRPSRAAGDGPTVVLPVGVPDPRATGHRRLVTQAVDLSRRPEVEVGHGVGPERPQLREALPHLERPARHPSQAVLGEDLNDSRRRLRAIQRARRRALDDLDAVDVRRIDVVERARLIVATAETIGVVEGGPVTAVTLAPHADAIHVNDRLVTLADAHRAPQADLRALARHAARLHHAQPGGPRLQQLIHARWRILDLRQVDLRDRVAHLSHPCLPGRAGHDDRIELQHTGCELQGRRCSLIGEHDQVRGGHLEPDREHAQLARTHGDVQQRERSAGPRAGADIDADERNLGTNDWLPCGQRRDFAFDRPGLSGQAGGGGQVQQRRGQRDSE